jgi:hypothetical protein
VERWGSGALAGLPASAFVNDYPYNRFGAGYAGITAKAGARAILTLPPSVPGSHLTAGRYCLVLHSVNGRACSLALTRGT